MSVRNCRDIGENLQKIMTRLMANDNLVNLLYYTNQDPLGQPALTQEQKKQFIYQKLIKIIPRIETQELATSVLAIQVINGIQNRENSEFRDIHIRIDIFVPLTQWIIKDTNLRPFAILGEVQESLNEKTINGLGKMIGGDFELSFLTDETSCYTQNYRIVNYE